MCLGSRLVLIGLGPAEDVDVHSVRLAMHYGARALKALRIREAAVHVPTVAGVNDAEILSGLKHLKFRLLLLFLTTLCFLFYCVVFYFYESQIFFLEYLSAG